MRSSDQNPATADFPAQVQLLIDYFWRRKIPPLAICRVVGAGFAKSVIREYIDARFSDSF